MFGPILRGSAIDLEPPRPEDSAERVRWFADHDAVRYFTSPGVPVEADDRASAERAARDPSVVLWRVTLDGRAIGSSFLSHVDWRNRHADSGTIIGDRSLWGRGYASEAVRLRTRFAFEEMGLERLESSSVAENVGMHRALERSGYRKVARRTRQFFNGGRWHDEYVFELLREDWLAGSVEHPGL